MTAKILRSGLFRAAFLGFLLMLLPVAAATGEENKPVYPSFDTGIEGWLTFKVENDGTAHGRFDQLGAWFFTEIGPGAHGMVYLEIPDLVGYADESAEGYLLSPGEFPRTQIYLETEFLRSAEGAPSVSPLLYLGYGYRQQALVQEVTRFSFERSGTSGIDGFDIAAGIGIVDRFRVMAAFNPTTLQSGDSYPDVFAYFGMENDHRGSSWGETIHFISSSMRLFYDSFADLSSNRLYDNPPEKAMTLGIGGTLVLNFAGIDIFGFGTTEYFFINDGDAPDIMQAQWCAGFDIPLMHGLEANLSGSNAVYMSATGEGSFINFGLDMKLMVTPWLGWFGAAAAVGILDDGGASLETGLCLEFGPLEIFTGYSDHAVGTADKYAKGAFDRIELRDGAAPGGGFFISAGLSWKTGSER